MFLFEKDGKKLVYNVINGGFANIEDDVYKALKNRDILPLSKKHPDIFKDLKDTLFLVDSKLNETEYVRYSYWKAKLR